MKQVLVTGVAGFIGSHVARRLNAEGYKIYGVDDLSQGKESNIPKGIEFIKADLSDPECVQFLPKECHAILHLAGQSSGEISFDNPASDIRKNVFSTLNLLRWGIERKCPKLVYASSMSVYGAQPDEPVKEDAICRPSSCYGVGKLASEYYLAVYSKYISTAAFRMFNVYGPGQDMENLRQGMVSIYLQQALEGGDIHVKGSLERYRDFVYIDDVVEVWAAALKLDFSSPFIANLGTGARTSVGDLLKAIGKRIPATRWHVDGRTPGDQFGIYADNGRLSKIFGFSHFTGLEEGLDKFIRWAQQRRKQNADSQAVQAL